MGKCAMLVVDVQTALIDEHPYNAEKVIENIKHLISVSRDSNVDVIYVRHNDEGLVYGTKEWEIYHEIAPINDERIFEKEYNSAFFKTDLKNDLETKQIDTLILVGLQTEYCIDTTLKSAFDLGYRVIIPEQSNTTFDNHYLTGEKLYEFYNYTIWNHRFTHIQSVEEVSKMLKENTNQHV